MIKKIKKLLPFNKKQKDKKYLRESPKNIYDAVDFLRKVQIDARNSEVINSIRTKISKGGRLNIGFVVNESAKWNCGALMDEMQKNERFHSQIIVSARDLKGSTPEDRKELYLKTRNFYLNIDEKLIDLYDWENDLSKPIEDIQADVLFFQQPWSMNDFPRRIAGKSLGVYMHYGFMMMANHGMHYNVGTFHSYLWKYFTQTEVHRLMHLKHDSSAYDKLVVTGYPKLDVYFDKIENEDTYCTIWKQPIDVNAKRIIYAPHHSLEGSRLQMSTFEWMHKTLLEIARDESGLQWIYKPHPTLKHNVVRKKFMTKAQYEKYEKTWADLPNGAVYDSGNYFNIFKTSDALITDSGSFLAEYLPTGKPIIWLASNNTVGFNPVGAMLAESFYTVRNIKEFKNIFEDVIIKGNDPLLEKRMKAIDILFPIKNKSSVVIIDYLKAQFGIQ